MRCYLETLDSVRKSNPKPKSPQCGQVRLDARTRVNKHTPTYTAELARLREAWAQSEDKCSQQAQQIEALKSVLSQVVSERNHSAGSENKEWAESG
jgi:hypothetical protein